MMKIFIGHSTHENIVNWEKVNGMLFNSLDPDENITNSTLSDVDPDINSMNCSFI